MYLTENEINKALNLGFTVTQCPNKGTSATRGDLHIWNIREGYQTADLIEGRYTNHKKYNNFLDAIQRLNYCPESLYKES